MRKEIPVEKTEQYKEGYKAFEKGEDKETCTYLKDSSSHIRWIKGWEDAKGDDEGEET